MRKFCASGFVRVVAVCVAGMLVGALGGCTKKGDAGGSAKANRGTIDIAHIQGGDGPYAAGAQKFKDTLEQASGRKLKAAVHNGTAGTSESTLIEKLETGDLDVVVVSADFLSAVGVTEAGLFSLLYLFNSYEHWDAAMTGDFGSDLAALIAEKTQGRFTVLGYWTAGVRDFYGKRPVRGPSDLRGMTIVTQTAQAKQDFWKSCGAIPTSVAASELRQALDLGVVDSAENDLATLFSQNQHTAANGKNVTETRHDYTTRLLLTSGRFWEGLSDQQKEWVTAAVAASGAEVLTAFTHSDDAARTGILAGGAPVIPFGDVDIASFRAIATPIQDKFARDNHVESLLQAARAADSGN